MATAPTPSRSRPITAPEFPPLANGDRLTRAEFHRRYEAMPEVKKAQLIEGVVYMPSPVNHQYHGKPNGWFTWCLVTYELATPGVDSGDNSTLLMDVGENEPQPDGFLRILPSHGGQSRDNDDGYIEGSPELIGEIAASSASYDLHTKRRAYRRNNVREYLVWRVYDQAMDWFILRNQRYVRLNPDREGIYRCEIFPGFWLDAPALIRGDLARVHQVLQQGIDSPEHAAFVARLQAAASSRKK